MPFKIVKTIEKGKERLSIIPSSWEKDGNLRWPGKNVSWKLMVRNENSKPLPDWTIMQCTVKRPSITTYKKAEEELNDMLNHSETSDFPDDEGMIEKGINYNTMAASLILQQQQQCEEENPLMMPIAENNILCQDSTQESTSIPTENTLIHIISNDSNMQPDKFDQLLENQKQILDNQKSIMENQNFIHETQKQILEKEDKNYRQMANITVLIDDCFSRLISDKNLSVVKLADANPIESEAFMIKPVANAKELNQLENQLSDKTQKQKMHLQYALLCNKSNGSGINCAYKLLDIIFTRKFLCECSWSGGSKGQAIKIALKGYRNILNFFFGLINFWDSSYTHDTNEKFFKTVLKNSGKRLEIKNLRASTKRNRKDPGTSNKRQKNSLEVTVENGEETSKIKETGEEGFEKAISEEITENTDNQGHEKDIITVPDVQEGEKDIENNQVNEKLHEEESLC